MATDYLGRTYYIQGSPYTVEKTIAEGGFAFVFQVQDVSGRRYALKRLAVNDQADLLLCKQEIAVMKAMLRHPHSVQFIGSVINQLNVDVSEVLILMELIKGGQLLDIMNQRIQQGFDEQEVLKIFCDICLAVTRLHHRTKPITHRDLKVENILLRQNGDYVLCDYGSCCLETLIPEEMGVTQCEDQIKRFTTLAYRAPEMVDLYSGKPISIKSDIWALGCLLYKLCFFTTPFGEQTLAILSGTFSIPDSSPYSEELHRLIRYILEPDMSKRPDIYQVCHVVHHLRGFNNPVANVFNSPIPDLSAVPRPPMESEAKQTNAPMKTRIVVPQVQTTSIIARERPRANTPNNPQSNQLPITASPQAPRRSLQQQGIVAVEQTTKPASTAQATKQQHLASNPIPQSIPQGTLVVTDDFDPRQYEKQSTKPYLTPFDTHQGTEETDVFGQQPFCPVNGDDKSANRNSSPTATNATNKDAFGSTPFTSGPKPTRNTNLPQQQQGPVGNNKLDQFGLEPFSGSATAKMTVTSSKLGTNQPGNVSRSSQSPSPTDQFGHTPFVVQENALFKQSDSFHSSSASSCTSPSDHHFPTSHSEDLLITNRRLNIKRMNRDQIKDKFGAYPTAV